MNYETCGEIELALSKYFNPRVNIIVPNVWWGLGLGHECDVFVLTPSMYAYEVEIKTSKADLIADLKKPHLHSDVKIKKLYFAIPKKMENCVDFIPSHAGILIVENNGLIEKRREAANNEKAIKLKDTQKQKLLHLGVMRIWGLKRRILDGSQRSS